MVDRFETLIAAVRAGDDVATAELVRRYEPVLRCRLRIWLRMQDPRLRTLLDSMDICQSVLASFFRRAADGQYELAGPEQLAALLVRMARNKLAHERSRLFALRRDARRTASADSPEAAATPSRDPSPSALARGSELADELRARLDASERALLDLRLAGSEWDEVASKLGGTADARRMQLARAIDRASVALGVERRRD